MTAGVTVNAHLCGDVIESVLMSCRSHDLIVYALVDKIINCVTCLQWSVPVQIMSSYLIRVNSYVSDRMDQ